MVKAEKHNGLGIYTCEECGYGYGEKKMAEKCEAFCAKHHACSLEITKHAVKK